MRKEKPQETEPEIITPPSFRARRSNLRWFGFFFLVSACWFFLGVLVGRGSAPLRFDIKKLQSELVALRETYIKKELARFLSGSDTDNHEIDLDFYEKLKDNQDIKNKAVLIPKKATARPTPKRQIQPLPVRDKKKAPSPKNEVVRKNGPAATKKASAPQPHLADSNSRPAEADPKYTIQVASVQDLNAAKIMVARLRNRNFPAYSTMGNVPGKGIWYRIRIGIFSNKTQADQTIGRLKQENIHGILVNIE
jgi:hypothetical protein